ncbi:DUF805 domain-containing protein [Ensifer adhaerens]|uniref:DUF805 domain-containing protein n=1 Tax=Ensifer adhaerens TaxID=106592 RepID=UPI000CF09DF3|nr:DUF805 domain-containing protein [Ensifer adhaerens]
MTPEGPQPSMTWLFFSPSGRIGRLPFFLSWLFWFLIGGFMVARMVANEGNETALAIWTLLFVVSSLVSLPSIAMLAIKRLHDIGYPGPLSLTLFIPVLSPVVFIALCLWPGDQGPNEFGAHSDEPGP